MALIPAVRSQVSAECLANRIRKGRCSLNLDGTPGNRLIVDLDREGGPIGRHGRRCDYLFFAEAGSKKRWAAPIELKGGTFKSTNVKAQLQAGARTVELLVPARTSVCFVPIVAGTCHKAERKRLGLSKLVFRGTQTRIKLRPCNSRLVEAFERR